MIGYLADVTGGYTAGLMYLISCGVIASGLILSLRTTRPEPDTPQPRLDTAGKGRGAVWSVAAHSPTVIHPLPCAERRHRT